jgi:Fe2+ transport system protein B
MERTTRIADLPDNISYELVPQQQQFQEGPNTQYIPMNIHPNPYGISAQNPIMGLPEQSSPSTHRNQDPQMQQIEYFQQQQQQMQQQQQQQMTEQQIYEIQMQPPSRLPSRDIPISTTQYTNDPQVHANYIPPSNVSSDYVQEATKLTEEKIKKHQQEKHRENRFDELMTEFQIPILICLLYFIFQLPVINSAIFKRFSLFAIYHADGNFNIYGLAMKSLLFGLAFYFVTKTIHLISEF